MQGLLLKSAPESPEGNRTAVYLLSHASDTAMALAVRCRAVREKNSVSGRGKRIRQLTRSTILTEDDRTQFRTLFEKVHPGFITEQKALYPGITPAEIRLLMLQAWPGGA